jgi:hypothetical protein
VVGDVGIVYEVTDGFVDEIETWRSFPGSVGL